MEAFQLSLGRDTDFDLTKITFKPTISTSTPARIVFVNGGHRSGSGDHGTCNFCHSNGGANALTPLGVNRNFNTNVEDRPHPARTPAQPFPNDGGFGKTPAGPNGAFGNGMFNTASVVEAADTAPFFHNNVEGILVNTPTITKALEDAVRFYNGPEFNNPRPTGKFAFTELELDQIVAFLQGLNTIQNIDVARRELEEIFTKQGNPRREQDTRLQTAFDETQDGIEVLDDSGLYPTAGPTRRRAKSDLAGTGHRASESAPAANPAGDREAHSGQERRRHDYSIAHGLPQRSRPEGQRYLVL